MCKIPSRRLGFSLTEVLIATALIGMVAIGAGALFSGFSRSSRQVAQINQATLGKNYIIDSLRNSNSCKKTLAGLPLTDIATDIVARDNAGNAVINKGQVYNGMRVQSLTARSGTSATRLYLVKVRLVMERQPSSQLQNTYTDDFLVNAAFDASGNIVDCLYNPAGTWTLVNSSSIIVPASSTDPTGTTWQRLGLLTTGATFYGVAPTAHYYAGLEKFVFKPASEMTTKCQRAGFCEGHAQCLSVLGESDWIDCPTTYSGMSTPIKARGNMWQLSVQALLNSNGDKSVGELWVYMFDVDTSTLVKSFRVGDCYSSTQCKVTSSTRMVPTTIGHEYRFYYSLKLVRAVTNPLPGSSDDYPYFETWNPRVHYQEYIKY